MSDLESMLRETLHRHATGLPATVTASPRLVAAVRRRRATNSALLCALVALVVLGIVVGLRIMAPNRIEPVVPTPKQPTSLVYVGQDGAIVSRADDGSTDTWVTGQGLRDLCGVPCFPSSLAWSPDGRTLAVLTGPACCLESTDVSVVVMSPGGAEARRLFQCPEGSGCADGLPYRLAWSRDSHSVAFSADKELYVVPLDGGPDDLVCTCRAWGVYFLPDGRLTYLTHGDVRAIDLETAETSTLATFDRATDVTWSPDGRYAVVTTDDTYFSVADFADSTPTMVPPQRVDGLFVTWSPDGSRFVYIATTGDKYQDLRHELWVAGPGQQPVLLHRFPHVNGGLAPPVWSSDGATLEFFQGSGTAPGGGTVWLVDPETGKVVDKVSGAEGGAAWQPEPGNDG
jgi:Tol biopolymer transport system component